MTLGAEIYTREWIDFPSRNVMRYYDLSETLSTCLARSAVLLAHNSRAEESTPAKYRISFPSQEGKCHTYIYVYIRLCCTAYRVSSLKFCSFARGTMRLDNEGCLSLSRPECHVLCSPLDSSQTARRAGSLLRALCNFPLVSRSGSLYAVDWPDSPTTSTSSLASSFREARISMGLILSAFTSVLFTFVSCFIVHVITLNVSKLRVNQHALSLRPNGGSLSW